MSEPLVIGRVSASGLLKNVEYYSTSSQNANQRSFKSLAASSLGDSRFGDHRLDDQ